MAIDPTVVEEIRNRNPIEDVISGYVSLKRAGTNLVGLCPFHSEKSPSFTVFPGTSSFYCFGCGAAGNVVSFICKIENLDYVSSLEFLAKRAGITIRQNTNDRKEAYKKQRILAMNRDAAFYFNHELLKAPEGREALEYLTGRGLSLPLIRHFGLGYSPGKSSAVIDYLSRKGYTKEEMKDAFLAGISSVNNDYYGMFRNRVMFPIIGITGDVIAFGGRVMDDSKPKYLNSGDTLTFNKRRNLFALNFAKTACAEQIILCEGYMDVISLHGAGFTNAVATLGTAITSDQARMMRRYTKEVIICYDADEAGQNAAGKAFTLLNEVGLEAKVLKVKNAKDPDEYIKKYGAAAFKKLMESGRSEFDFRMDAILSKYDIEEQNDRVRAIRDTENLIAGIQSSAQRDVYIASCAKRFDVSPDSVRRDVDAILRSNLRSEQKKASADMMRKAEGYGDRVNPDMIKNPRAGRAEEAILGILMLHPEYIEQMRRENKLFPVSDFQTAFGRKVYSLMSESEKERFDPASLDENLTQDEVSRLTYLQLQRDMLTNNSLDVLLECHETLISASGEADLDLSELLASKRLNQS